jgi:hypothetical protein
MHGPNASDTALLLEQQDAPHENVVTLETRFCGPSPARERSQRSAAHLEQRTALGTEL